MKARFVAVTALACVGLAACTSPTPGTGTPASSGTSTTTGSAPSSPSGGSALAGKDPCSLLTSSQVSQNDLQPQGPSNDGGARACSWQNATAFDGSGYAVELAIRESQGLADINTDGLAMTDDTIGGHQGKQGRDTSDGDCLVFIGVGQKSRVDVVVSAGDSNPAHSCPLANQYAKLIEPSLP